MHTFEDRHGREWSVQITVAQIKEMRQWLGLKFKPENRKFWKAMGDTETRVSVLWICCRHCAEGYGIDPTIDGKGGDDFARAIHSASAIDSAGEALLAAFVDFLSPRARAVAHNILQQS